MKHYDISTLDPSPAMTRTTVEFLGTFAQAVNAAHASFDRTGRATAIFDHNGSYAWYRIDGGGRVTNNNTVDDLHLDSGFCFDYKHQAWVENGRYVRCGHPESMDCRCYGKVHQGEICTGETH